MLLCAWVDGEIGPLIFKTIDKPFKFKIQTMEHDLHYKKGLETKSHVLWLFLT